MIIRHIVAENQAPEAVWKNSESGYGLSAFQNRSQNIAATLRSIFMIWWMLVIFGKNRDFGLFWGNAYWTNGVLKIDLEVAETFWDRFWKAQTPYFRSPNFNFEFGPFRNQNGKPQFQHQKPTFFAIYRFGSKKASKIRDFVEKILFSENMDQGLSKSGLRMCLRPLVMILWYFEGWSKWVKNRGGA